MANIKGMVNDPDFQGLSAADQQSALSAIDPAFGSLSPSDFQSAIKAIGGPSTMDKVGSAARVATTALTGGVGTSMSDVGNLWNLGNDVGKAAASGLASNPGGITPTVNAPGVDTGEEIAGNLMNPIAAGAGEAVGLIGEATGIGPWMSNWVKGVAGDFALLAINKVKALAKALNITGDGLDALGEFLLGPIKVGSQTFDPIIKANSSPQSMLDYAQEIREAIGDRLGVTAKNADAAISDITNNAGTAINNSPITLDLGGLLNKIQDLKQSIVGGLENTAPDVVNEFNNILKDLQKFASNQINGETDKAFSELTALKTKLGNLTNFNSATKSNAALQQIYGIISQTLQDAAQKLPGVSGTEYAASLDQYRKIMAVIAGLQGRSIDAHNLFTATGAIVGAIAGHGIMSVPAAAAGAVAARTASNYGPQVIAAGLNALPGFVSTASPLAAQAANAIGNALTQ
jgi:hypothetical protein